MVDGEFEPANHEGKEVYDATGGRLGTVADVDADEKLLYLAPDPDPGEEWWAVADGQTAVSVDNNWFMTPSYRVQEVENTGEADGESREGVAFEEWPYTVGEAAIDEIGDEAIRLKY